MMNYTYIVKCADGTLYTGWTNCLQKRMKAHNEGKNGAGMAGEVYRLLCGGFDDRGGYFYSGGHDDFWYGQVSGLPFHGSPPSADTSTLLSASNASSAMDTSVPS